MIEAKKVNFEYLESFSLKNINLKVQKGKILGIIGQSGSGKTTLLKLLAGLKEPSSGQININGTPLEPPSKKLIAGHRQIKMVTQQNTLFPNITIAENIAYEVRFFEKKYQNQRVSKLAKDLNISHLLGKFPRELSGGEIQRVMLAKAIADEPLLLLLDEPFANLDSIIKKKVMLNLQSVLRKEQIACIFVTHDIHDAFGMVDELFIIKNGRMVQKGTSEDIYNFPKNKYVALLTGDGFMLKTTEKEVFVRAENIDINPTGELEAEVINNIFKGAFYEIILEYNSNTIYALSKNIFPIGQKIRFDIHSVIHFD
ncbi:ABC transporter ATP-binding protein [Lacihabitans soyangensis]|uniref:ABC transporter ATP-binding protein n=1 Tax=Lacihabitans soyangensis TaxID=869394 RepID=A0AAE3KRU3_9BACT|nr:ABC transporter ATP-binding protein [Lacihabitans soyangensis]MCP9762577.1 ABC transporter ATP-binding protein [Lacihabitans soyangensis]